MRVLASRRVYLERSPCLLLGVFRWDEEAGELLFNEPFSTFARRRVVFLFEVCGPTAVLSDHSPA